MKRERLTDKDMQPATIQDAYINLVYNGIVKYAVRDLVLGTKDEQKTARDFLETFPMGRYILNHKEEIEKWRVDI